LLVGDVPGAMAVCEGARAARRYWDDVRVVHALALAGLGRLGEAWDTVKPSWPGDQHARTNLLWMRGALAVLLGHEADVKAPDSTALAEEPPDRYSDDIFWWWWRFAEVPDAERKQARRRLLLEPGPPPRL